MEELLKNNKLTIRMSWILYVVVYILTGNLVKTTHIKLHIFCHAASVRLALSLFVELNSFPESFMRLERMCFSLSLDRDEFACLAVVSDGDFRWCSLQYLCSSSNSCPALQLLKVQ